MSLKDQLAEFNKLRKAELQAKFSSQDLTPNELTPAMQEVSNSNTDKVGFRGQCFRSGRICVFLAGSELAKIFDCRFGFYQCCESESVRSRIIGLKSELKNSNLISNGDFVDGNGLAKRCRYRYLYFMVLYFFSIKNIFLWEGARGQILGLSIFNVSGSVYLLNILPISDESHFCLSTDFPQIYRAGLKRSK